jgi:hypothetical protein
MLSSRRSAEGSAVERSVVDGREPAGLFYRVVRI